MFSLEKTCEFIFVNLLDAMLSTPVSAYLPTQKNNKGFKTLLLFTIFRKGLGLNESKLVLEEKRQKFFRPSIDDETFLLWKDELQKELPSFWESMNE
jgi:hypothetical protein